MPKKHVQITDEDVEMVLKVKSEHPELNNFSAAVRWILLDYRTKIANTERQNDILDLQKKLGELSKEQSLATQLLVNMGDALGIKAGTRIDDQAVFLDAKAAVNQRIDRAVTARSTHSSTDSSQLGYSHRSGKQ